MCFHYLRAVNIDRGEGVLFMDLISKKSGYSVGGGAPFIPIRAAQWRVTPKKFDFLGVKLPRFVCIASILCGPQSSHTRDCCRSSG